VATYPGPFHILQAFHPFAPHYVATRVAHSDGGVCYRRRRRDALPTVFFFFRPVPSSLLPSRFHSTTTDPAPPHIFTIPLTVDDIQTRYREHFCRALRMPVDASVDLVDSLRPRLPRRGLSPACRTAIALRYLGGGSYLDVCAAFRVYPSTMYRALWEVLDAANTTPSLAFDFGLGNCLLQRNVGCHPQ